MNKIIFAIGTIFLSISIETMSELSIFKEAANLGYKINMEKFFEYLSEKDKKVRNLLFIIPGINIVNSIFKLSEHKKIKNELLGNIHNSDIFIKMSDEEYQYYSDNPKSVTAFNMAFDYSLKHEEKNIINEPVGFIRITNGNYRHDFNDGTFNDISFRKEDDKIVVTDIKGVISSLDKDDQLKELNRIFKCLYKKKAVIEEKSSITLQKEALIAHRDEVLNYKNEEDIKLILK